MRSIQHADIRNVGKMLSISSYSVDGSVQQIFNLSDEKVEYQMLDTLRFQPLLGVHHSSQNIRLKRLYCKWII